MSAIVKLAESELEEINFWLRDKYGYFAINVPMWRISWSDDQYEKRFGTFEDTSPSGMYLGSFTGVREVRKYSHIHSRYVLERAMDTGGNSELAVGKFSYEPVWTFMDRNKEFLPPNIGACYFIIESIHEAAAKRVGVKYKDPRNNPEEAVEAKAMRMKDLREKLFGNESSVGDALAYKEAVSISNTDNWEKKQ